MRPKNLATFIAWHIHTMRSSLGARHNPAGRGHAATQHTEFTMDAELRSEMALRVYAWVWHGVDTFVGDTLEPGPGGAISLSPGRVYYARHHDPLLSDRFLPTLFEEITRLELRGLSLASCRRITDAGLEALTKHPGVEFLDLFNTRITDAGLAYLEGLPRLRLLNLAGTGITARGLQKLAACRGLEVLHLGWTATRNESLADLTSLPHLRMLDLRHTAVTDAGLAQLARLPELSSLDLQSTSITDAGLAALGDLSERLEHLYLGYTKITPQGVDHLKRLTKLQTLMLRGTLVDETQDEALRAACSGLTVAPGAVPTDSAQRGIIR